MWQYISQKKAYCRFQLQATSHIFQSLLRPNLYLDDKNISF